jgi:predicted metal-dependent phosphoesterase TrpH
VRRLSTARIDLHTHSRVSDGTETPGDLVREAARVGLDVVAITDHDTVAGWDEAFAAAPVGLTVVPGVELSCFVIEEGRRISLHLLGYWPDPHNAELTTAMSQLRESRDTRARAMVEAIAAAGYDVSWDDVLDDADGGVVGRPHVARALVRAGLVPDVSAAFTPQWISGRGARFYVDKRELPVAQGVSLIAAAGGVTVFAHPRAVKRGPTVTDETITSLADHGLTGLEVDHPDHDETDRIGLRTLAAELGLIVTGSSDWHGGNKPTPMGAELTDPDAFAALAAHTSRSAGV